MAYGAVQLLANASPKLTVARRSGFICQKDSRSLPDLRVPTPIKLRRRKQNFQRVHRSFLQVRLGIGLSHENYTWSGVVEVEPAHMYNTNARKEVMFYFRFNYVKSMPFTLL